MPNYWNDSEYIKIRNENDFCSYGEISNNYICYNSMEDFPGFNNGDYYMKENSKAKEKIPGFENIPYEQMGRFN